MVKVVVLGSSGFDLTIRLPRLPGRGETLLGGELHTGPGGKGANQALAARRAGAEVTFLTAFGDDDFGRRIYEHDRAEGLDLAHAKTVSGVANQVALIFVGGDAENLIGVAPGASAWLRPDDIDRLPDSVFDPQGVFLASLEVPLETVERGLRRAAGAGMTTVLNPAPADVALRDRAILPLVDVLTPNQEEARALTGMPAENRRQAERAAILLRQAGARQVIVTLGPEGCLVVSEGSTERVSAYAVNVVDTVGAGDAFNGALAVALAERRSLRDAAAWACAAAAIAVTRPGAQGALPGREEIDRLAVGGIRKSSGDHSQ
jgi:ribokinase